MPAFGALLTLQAAPGGASCIAAGLDVMLEKAFGSPELQLRAPLRLNASRAWSAAREDAEVTLTLSGEFPRILFEDDAVAASSSGALAARMEGATTALLFKPPRARELHVIGNLTLGGKELMSLCPVDAAPAAAASAWSGALGNGVTYPRRVSQHADVALQLAARAEGAGGGPHGGFIWQDSEADDDSRVALLHGADGSLHLFANKLVVNGAGCEAPRP